MEKAKWLIQGAITGALLAEFARYAANKTKTRDQTGSTTEKKAPSGQVIGSTLVSTTGRQQGRRDYESVVIQVQSSSSPVAPVLPIVIIQPNPMLEIAFDRRTKNPCYVLEKIDSATASPEAKDSSARRTGKETFYEEKSLIPYHRSRNSYYKNSGFDRGHLAPVADFTAFFKSNEDASNTLQLVNDTFNLCNASPQYPSFNRNIWANVEQFGRNIIKEELSENLSAYIITGPVYLPSTLVSRPPSTPSLTKIEKSIFQYSHLGIGSPPCIVCVPTHFFKIIAIVSKDDNTVAKAAAFVLPNKEFSITDGVISLDSYIVTLEDLEAVTGLEFFHQMFGKSTNSTSNDEEEDGISNSNATSLRKQFLDALTRDLIEDLRNDNKNNSEATLVISKQQHRNIKKAFYKSKEDPIGHLCHHHRCSIDLRTGKRLSSTN